VGATLTAIESLGQQTRGKLILLLGGVSKDADFSGLQPAIQAYCRHTILFGRDQNTIAQHLLGVEMTQVTTLKEAVESAKNRAQPDDCVLFSPACASFDQFSNYIQRGDAFVALVKAAHTASVGRKTIC